MWYNKDQHERPREGEQEMIQYYKASEAIKRLGIPRSSFFAPVQAGQIPYVTLPLRKHVVYPKDEIDKIATEQDRILKGVETEPERLKLMIPTLDDFKQIVEIDHELFPEETLMTAEELQQRLPYNPDTTHILKDTKTNKVVGYISMSPLKQDILDKLITLQIDETSLKPEYLAPYIPNTPIDCYIISVGARPGPGIVQQVYAGKLVLAIKNYLLELLEREVILQHIYTVATSEQGDRLAQGLHFTPLKTTNEWKSNYEDFRRPYMLDLGAKNSKSKIVIEYQKQLKNRVRRLKRYVKLEKTKT